jgi:uncharacterized membrane protein
MSEDRDEYRITMTVKDSKGIEREKWSEIGYASSKEQAIKHGKKLADEALTAWPGGSSTVRAKIWSTGFFSEAHR